MITCPNCNKQVKEGARFCDGCGTQLEQPVAVVTPVVSEENTEFLSNSAEDSAVTPVTEPVSEPTAASAQPQSFTEVDTPAPAPSVVPETPRRPVYRRSIWVKILSVLFAALFCLFAFAAEAVGVARYMLSDSNIDNIFEEIDWSEIKLYDSNGSEQQSLPEMLACSFDSSLRETYNITEKSMTKVLAKVSQDQSVRRIVTRYTDYMLGNHARLDELDTDEIVGIIRSHENTIYKETGYRLTEKNYEQIRSNIMTHNYSFDGIEQSTGVAMKPVRLALSSVAYWLLVGIAALWAFLLLLINRKAISAFLRTLFISLITVGGVLLAGAGGLAIFLVAFDSPLLQVVLQPGDRYLALRGAILAVVGIVGVCIVSLVKRITRMRKA